MMSHRSSARLLAGVCGLAMTLAAIPLAASPASAAQQPGSTSRPTKQPATSPDTTRPAPATPAKEEPRQGPYIKLSQTKDLNLTVRVRVLRGNSETQINDPINGQTAIVTKTTPFDPMKSIAMIWPMLPGSGSSSTSIESITGKLLLNDTVADTSITAMKNYQGGVQYARFDAQAADSDLTPWKVELEVNIPASVSRTEFDEKAALALPWPAAWPRTVATWLQPQLFIESGFDENNRITPYKDEAIVKALAMAAEKAGVSDLKKVSPVAATKIITSFVWGHVQIVSNSVGRDGRSGELPPMRLSKGETYTPNDFGGVVIQPPQVTLETKRGTEYDTSALLTAMLKKAGIPAHPVVGYDRGGSGNSSIKNNLSSKSNRSGRGTKCWVEFALFDEANNTINWVPIDIGKLNKSSSRPAALEKPWRYFGTHDELNGVVPFAFHFFPPTDVVSYGAPGFWGWFVTPQAPKDAGQAISFSAAAGSVRGGEPANPGVAPSDDNTNPSKKEKRDEEKKKRGY
jgi:hypothetical protein